MIEFSLILPKRKSLTTLPASVTACEWRELPQLTHMFLVLKYLRDSRPFTYGVLIGRVSPPIVVDAATYGARPQACLLILLL
jgi:hypothetical protein